jgi:hypothetical protein
MILDAIGYALKVGCKSSLVEAISSGRFQQLAKVYANLEERFPPDTDEGIALRAGHLNMGKLLNTLPEAEAVLQAKTCVSTAGAGTDLRALVHCLGGSLVEAAEKCLPPPILELAQKWKTSDSDQQIEIARQLYFEFRSGTQGAHGPLTMQSVHEKMDRKLNEVHDEQSVLPGLYGMWDKEKCNANCQGKTQMLAAFGRLAGTRVLCASPIDHSRRGLEGARETMVREVIADLSQRGLEDADAEMAEGIRASRIEEHLNFEESFHIGVALELCDGRWILLDPHGLAWGVFPDVWELGNTYRTLEKYSAVLPGLQLIRHDHGRMEAILEQRLNEGRDLLLRSRKMEAHLKANGKSIMDLVDAVKDSDDMDILLRNEELEKGTQLIPASLSSDPEMRNYIALVLVLGGEDKLWNIGAMLDPGFFKKRTRSWITFYHASAMNLFGNQLNDEGKLVHEVCEFGLPEYHIAMSAINSLAGRFGGRPASDVHRFFLDYSFDQVSLHNALSDREVGQAAAQALKALPFVHTLCQWKLNRLAHLYERGFS